ncbi:MAG TPA: HypC/HybG/HupF family hydrogenase formation chaperone [Polyangiaceae bacterium]
MRQTRELSRYPPLMCLAIPGQVIRTYEKHGVLFAEARFAGVTREVCLHAEPSTQAGDYVLVHVGFAIKKIDREEADRTWRLLLELGDEEALSIQEQA